MKEGTYKLWTIRYSDGIISVHRGGYADIVHIAEERIKGTNLTYTIA
ncbi:MAG: hypothetical protein KH034_02835 [Lachnospiraceae bacterium]|nr:hypothetical protein [Lachnospiraceae bacterium]